MYGKVKMYINIHIEFMAFTMLFSLFKSIFIKNNNNILNLQQVLISFLSTKILSILILISPNLLITTKISYHVTTTISMK